MTDNSIAKGAAKGGSVPPFLVELAKNAPAMMWTFTGTTFLSALLLFAIQPMFAKTVLPVLGGSPSVWSVSVFFFQTALLGGYLYAHLLINKAPAHLTGLIHLGVCLAAAICLPIGMVGWVGEPPAGDPYLWQLGLFAASIGLPFMAVSANAPLLQAWFARTGHPNARDPYFMYAASNLGSLIALLGYPFLLEPAFGLSELTHLWAYAYGLLVLAIGGSFFLMRGAQVGGVPETAAAAPAGAATDVPAAAPTLTNRLTWVGLAFVPSALVTAYTVHITTDVASAPLLWVIPLAIYLLTFVLVFRDRPLIARESLLFLHLVALAVALIALAQYTNSWHIVSLTGLAVFVTTALLAHRTLYEARPAPVHLTEFYLWMSLGGALGGMFTALVAPQIFSEIYEYPLLLALSMACRPGALKVSQERLRNEGVALLAVAIALALLFWAGGGWSLPNISVNVRLGILALAAVGGAAFCYQNRWVPLAAIAAVGVAVIIAVPDIASSMRPQIFRYVTPTMVAVCVLTLGMLACVKHAPLQLAAAGTVCLALVTMQSEVKRGAAERSFFGVYRMQITPNGERTSLFRTLVHGTTLHGAQRVADIKQGKLAPADDTVPTTYYYPGSPMGQTIAKRREILAAKGEKGRYGIVGLGTGSSSCHIQEGETFKFFEIDPTVIKIAKNPKNFTFISKCQPDIDIAVGDARLTIKKEADASFDLFIIDAFSSDAIPVHMLTKEAVELFLSKLKPEGVVVLHTSNRYLDLNSVLAAIQKELPAGSVGMVMEDLQAGRQSHPAQTGSVVVVFAKSEEALKPYQTLKGVSELKDTGLRAWTDDYSDILSAFISRWQGKG
jgi:spermidine synthase